MYVLATLMYALCVKIVILSTTQMLRIIINQQVIKYMQYIHSNTWNHNIMLTSPYVNTRLYVQDAFMITYIGKYNIIRSYNDKLELQW